MAGTALWSALHRVVLNGEYASMWTNPRTLHVKPLIGLDRNFDHELLRRARRKDHNDADRRTVQKTMISAAHGLMRKLVFPEE